MISLHHAAQNGQAKVVDILLKNNADVEAKDDQGWSHLHFAAAHGFIELVNSIIAEVDARENYNVIPLHLAA